MPPFLGLISHALLLHLAANFNSQSTFLPTSILLLHGPRLHPTPTILLHTSLHFVMLRVFWSRSNMCGTVSLLILAARIQSYSLSVIFVCSPSSPLQCKPWIGRQADISLYQSLADHRKTPRCLVQNQTLHFQGQRQVPQL